MVFNNSAAEAVGAIFILSSMSSTSIEEVAAAAPTGIKWMQLYIFTDRKVLLDMVHRAEKSGFKALAITVDSPMTVKGRKFVRNKKLLEPHLQFVFSYFMYKIYNIFIKYIIYSLYC